MIQKRTGPSDFLIKLMVGYSSKKMLKNNEGRVHGKFS
jgi:hypothetical protein